MGLISRVSSRTYRNMMLVHQKLSRGNIISIVQALVGHGNPMIRFCGFENWPLSRPTYMYAAARLIKVTERAGLGDKSKKLSKPKYKPHPPAPGQYCDVEEE